MKMISFDMEVPYRNQDNSKAQYYPVQRAADITINWQTMNAPAIIALINACNPWNKGAVTKINNNIIRILNAHIVNDETTEVNQPGTIVLITDKSIIVADNENKLICIDHIYCDEGFLVAGRLKDIGIAAGAVFSSF
ncbi:MAG: hypothetical protein QM737_06330 [Ferruginibacter sp.]